MVNVIITEIGKLDFMKPDMLSEKYLQNHAELLIVYDRHFQSNPLENYLLVMCLEGAKVFLMNNYIKEHQSMD